jgi:hypothetical protein
MHHRPCLADLINGEVLFLRNGFEFAAGLG